ncbi:MAG: peptigoglycan-binding protein LysM [Pseudomonadota bacterium]
MQKFMAFLGGNSGMTAAGAIGVLLLAAAGWVQYERNQADLEQSTAAVVPIEEDQSDDSLAAPSTREQSAVQAVAPSDATPEAVEEIADAVAQVIFPAFDEVRRESDGMTVIAGRAAPDTEISILKNGTSIATVTTDGRGNFATLTVIPPDGQGHVLTLLQTVSGKDILSKEEVILAPLSAPIALAEVSPEAADPAAGQPPSEAPLSDVTENGVAAETDEGDTRSAADIAEASDDLPSREIEDSQPPAIETALLAEETSVASGVQLTENADDAQAAVTPAAESEDAEGSAANGLSVDTAALDAALDGSNPPVASSEPETPETPTASAMSSTAVFRATDEGVELLNPPSPDVMTNVEIDTISYSDLGAVQLSGRAQESAASVRVYLDNQAVINLPVDEDGRWRGDLPEVDEGVYTLRVDELSADGAVSSRVETPFRRESPALLANAAARQTGPINAITVQKGATLWAIARDRYGEGQLYVRVFDANRDAIRDPDLIYPGQVFSLPDE